MLLHYLACTDIKNTREYPVRKVNYSNIGIQMMKCLRTFKTDKTCTYYKYLCAGCDFFTDSLCTVPRHECELVLDFINVLHRRNKRF